MPDTGNSHLPLVTVITVTYNSSAYVRDAIESVLAQDYPNIEYIIGDDCSTDNTWAIIQEYKDPRIKAYRNETNLREYPNRNKAIGLATGKYLMFIDGDDIIYSHGIRFFVEQMEAFPDAGFAIQKGYLNNIVYPILLEPEQIVPNHFYGAVQMLSSSFASNFFKTDILKQSGSIATKYVSGDDEVRLRLAFENKVLLVAGWVTWPRETPGQASSRITPELRAVEVYSYSKEILNRKQYHLDPQLLTAVAERIENDVKKFILKELLRGRFSKAFGMMKNLDIRFANLFQLSKNSSDYVDDLEKYTPGKPLKPFSKEYTHS